ncbi:hypothetical protein WMF26_20905 [Sorangium sp. So ce185]
MLRPHMSACIRAQEMIVLAIGNATDADSKAARIGARRDPGELRVVHESG